MNELLYYAYRVVSVIFLVSSILIAIEFTRHRKNFIMYTFIFCVAAIVIIGMVEAITDIDLDKIICENIRQTNNLARNLG